MDNKVMYQIQRCMAWTGPISVVGYFFFWMVLGHNLPKPPPPGWSGAELVANYYMPHRDQILLGQCVATFFGLLNMVWCIQLSEQMRIREKGTHVLSQMQLTGGLLTAFILSMCSAIWAWCVRYAGTPGVEDELVKAMHIISWYVFNMTYIITTIQYVGAGLFAIFNRKEPAIFPVWAGWIAIVFSMTMFPLTFLPYFLEPSIFAINGYWSFHVIAFAWGIAIWTYSYFMFKDLKRIKLSPTMGIGQAISH